MTDNRLQRPGTKEETCESGPLAQLAEQRAFNPLVSVGTANTCAPVPADSALFVRFRSKLNTSGPTPAHAPDLGPCHLWTGGVGKDGYGRTSLDGRKQQAHRAAWLIAHGSIPDGQVIRHRCDTKLCCRLEHLVPGTHQQNADDASERGLLAGINTHHNRRPGVAHPDERWMAPFLVQGSAYPSIADVEALTPKRRRARANAIVAYNALMVKRRELGIEAGS